LFYSLPEVIKFGAVAGDDQVFQVYWFLLCIIGPHVIKVTKFPMICNVERDTCS